MQHLQDQDVNLDGEDVVGTFKYNEIVRITPNGDVKLDTCGWYNVSFIHMLVSGVFDLLCRRRTCMWSGSLC